MASHELIVQSLKSAAASSDLHKLKEAHQAIQASLACRSTHRTGLESLVICAETAMKVRQWTLPVKTAHMHA